MTAIKKETEKGEDQTGKKERERGKAENVCVCVYLYSSTLSRGVKIGNNKHGRGRKERGQYLMANTGEKETADFGNLIKREGEKEKKVRSS